MNGLWDDLAAAIELLTRIPVGWIRRTIAMPDLARIVWAYPVVGCIVGAIGSLVYWLATTLGCPAPLAAIWCVGALKDPVAWPTATQVLEVRPDKTIAWALRQWTNPDLGPISSIQFLPKA